MISKKVRLLQYATLIVPIITFIWLQATIFNINPTVVIESSTVDYVVVRKEVDKVFYFSQGEQVKFKGGIVEWNSDIKRVGVYLKAGDTLKVNKDYFAIVLNEKTNELEVKDIDAFKLQTKETMVMPISVGITIALIISFFVIKHKMEWFKEHKKTSTWLALFITTVIMYGINTIVSDMLWTFVVLLISFTFYSIEEIVALGIIKEKDKDKLIDELDKAKTKL